MVNTSKILTVSYGTFSCTLEGFDDSFDTMKAIAEYFRDLAADDRYFGAEPPSPDAEMLARIAQREISRRVEAHEDQGKIVLRAAETPAMTAAAATAAVTSVSEEPASSSAEQAADMPLEADGEDIVEDAVPEMAVEPSAPDAETDDVSFVSDTDATPDSDAAPDSVVEPETEAQMAEQPGSEEMSAPAPDRAAPETRFTDSDEMEWRGDGTAEEPVAETGYAGTTDFSVGDIEIPMVEDAALEAEMPEAEITGPEMTTEPETDASTEEFFSGAAEDVDELTVESEVDSVADKLNRIRSVVARAKQPDADDTYIEDEHAQGFLNETAADLDAALAIDDETEMQAGGVSVEPEAESAQPKDDLQTEAEDVLARLAGQNDQPIEVHAPELAEETGAADADLQDTLSQLLADAIDTDEAVEEETAHVEDISERQAMAEDDFDDMTDAEEDRPADLNARVIKVQREEVDAAEAGLSPEREDTPLSAEEENSLSRALAVAEEDIAADEPFVEENEAVTDPQNEAADATPEDATPETVAPAPRSKRHSFDTADRNSDLERIFEEADSQLGQPESNQRRNAIQHLRAAVAATRAEKKAGVDLQKDVDDSPYRNDLASVVRPRRPSAAAQGSRSARPSETRPAPLKLVAEQRVDMERAPIRPRRVSAVDPVAEPDEEKAETFGDYAAQVGATRLPDLLEAAAAYMSDIEGRAQFSRPMLMRKLQEAGQDNFSREDGLRSFGKLLRQGKIQKIKGGRFAVTDETEFRDETHCAG